MIISSRQQEMQLRMERDILMTRLQQQQQLHAEQINQIQMAQMQAHNMQQRYMDVGYIIDNSFWLCLIYHSFSLRSQDYGRL